MNLTSTKVTPSSLMPFLLFLALITIVSSCQNNANNTSELEAIQESINKTRTTKKKQILIPKTVTELFVSPKYGFEISIPTNWKAKQPYPIDIARSEIWVYPKTAAGYDSNQKLALRIPVLILSTKEWAEYKNKAFEDYPYMFGEVKTPSPFTKNGRYVFILENRWEINFIGEEEDEAKINTIKDVLKTIRPYELK